MPDLAAGFASRSPDAVLPAGLAEAVEAAAGGAVACLVVRLLCFEIDILGEGCCSVQSSLLRL